ncbi:MAG: hypothetical protein FIA97_03000 [Methylococcaceae bacterium]|nr:hypothetical protein [Methylococcaceae bacterium]
MGRQRHFGGYTCEGGGSTRVARPDGDWLPFKPVAGDPSIRGLALPLPGHARNQALAKEVRVEVVSGEPDATGWRIGAFLHTGYHPMLWRNRSG